MTVPTKATSYYAKNRNLWRKWLEKNHMEKASVWLIIYHKASATPSVKYDEAVEEALCFGWIDSKPNKRDEESFFLFFTKRKPKSVWSKLNKQRVKRLTAAGKITPAGQVMIDLAKATGTWTALDKVDNIEIPPDLQKLLNKNKDALKHFTAFPPSAKKAILQWILSAKRDETRLKRVNETVELASKNIRANQYVPKGTSV